LRAACYHLRTDVIKGGLPMRRAGLAAAAFVALAAPVAAQDRTPSHCLALAMEAATVLPVVFGDPVAEESVRIRYLDHAAFALETAGGLVAVTDYTGYLGVSDVVPDVVTMNNAHSTHWTANPDPRIPHALTGWPVEGIPADHSLDLGEMLVRNVTTDTRGPFGEGARANGNSIFIFEVAGLCIGHLGHLHQIPSAAQYAAIGRLDVVMVPVDGGYTMTTDAMAGVVEHLRSSIVIPMHWFSDRSLETFLTRMAGGFDIVRLDGPELEISRDRLPGRPTIMVLTPAWLP
jgi:L-ascorbate metabolism protein UlaG (beta-lactamase superfamily)